MPPTPDESVGMMSSYLPDVTTGSGLTTTRRILDCAAFQFQSGVRQTPDALARAAAAMQAKNSRCAGTRSSQASYPMLCVAEGKDFIHHDITYLIQT